MSLGRSGVNRFHDNCLLVNKNHHWLQYTHIYPPLHMRHTYCHKVHLYTAQSTKVNVPSSELGLSHPLSRQRVYPSPRYQRGGGHTRLGEGLGEPQFRGLEKKLSTLPTLCMLLTVNVLHQLIRIRKPQVWKLPRLCPETSTKLYVHEFDFCWVGAFPPLESAVWFILICCRLSSETSSRIRQRDIFLSRTIKNAKIHLSRSPSSDSALEVI